MQQYDQVSKSKLTKQELIFLVIAASFTITFVSTSSPLYPFNPWNDINCFFTMGRGTIHGLIPYRDLYEQKGPLLYFIFTLIALVSERSFIGLWIVECLTASLFAVYSWKTAKLFVSPSKISIIIMPLFIGIIYTIKMFNYGGNSEELCFPLLTVALYIGLKAIVLRDGVPTDNEALLCGIITASLFWIKFTFIGFMIGFCLYIIAISIKLKRYKNLIILALRFLLGCIIITLPIIIFFWATNSLSYLAECYFYNNIFIYHGNSQELGIASIPIIKHIYFPVHSIFVTIDNFPVFGIMLLFSLISLCFIEKNYRKKAILLVSVTFVFSAATTFTRAILFYYGYILSYCFSLCLIPLVKLINKLETIISKNNRLIKGIVVIFFLILYGMTILLCKNIYLFMQPKEYLSQYRIAATIKQFPNAKLLTYDVMDSGFYTATGILPGNRFFCHLNIADNYPALREEQDRLIKDGYFDFIVTTYDYESSWDNYELVQVETHPYVDFTNEKVLEGFKLYKKIS